MIGLIHNVIASMKMTLHPVGTVSAGVTKAMHVQKRSTYATGKTIE